MTIKDIIDNLPSWIKRVEKIKGFSNTLISRGWDWDHLYINGDNAIKLLLEYHYADGSITPVELKLANCVFQKNLINLDLYANVPAAKMKQDELIKIRLMYLFFYVHKTFLLNKNLKNNPENKIILEVENDGSISVRA